MRPNDVRDLALVAIVGAGSALLLLQPGLPALLSALGGAALLLGVPGFALMRALFPDLPFDIYERVAVSIGLSLALAIVGGLVLNVTPWGLTAASWGVLLGGLTLVACAILAVRLQRGPVPVGADQEPPVPGDLERAPLVRIPAPQLAMLAAAAALALGAFLVARVGVAEQRYPGFSQLWVLGEPSGTEVRLGVANHESRDQTYRLVLTVDGQTLETWPTLDVHDGTAWELTVPLPPRGSLLRSVEATLYRADDATPYRTVHLAVRAVPGGGVATPAPSVGP